MEIDFPSDCGNSPRVGIVNDFVADWAARNAGAMAERLASAGFEWYANAEAIELTAADPVTACVDEAREIRRVTIRSTITHGRLAACDGALHASDGVIDFCHIISFTTAGKTAPIACIRTYLCESS